MICQKCKNALNLEYRFCPYCGKSVSANSLDLTLGEVYDLWRGEHFPQISKKGAEGYRTAWNRLSRYQYMKITEVKTFHYQKIIKEMIDGGLSRSSMEKVKQLASQLCKFALKNDIINKNYGTFISLPKAKKSARDRFSDEELHILWENAEDTTVQIMLILAYTGFRINELFTIRKSDVHLNDPIPYIIGGSKTDAGRNRSVVICYRIIGIVKTLYSSQGEYLISSKSGKQCNVCNWRKRKYYPTLERLGLPHREIHCLRHTFASMMVKAGADLKSVAQLMGHTKIGTTMDIYTHTDLSQLSKAIEKLSYA